MCRHHYRVGSPAGRAASGQCALSYLVYHRLRGDAAARAAFSYSRRQVAFASRVREYFHARPAAVAFAMMRPSLYTITRIIAGRLLRHRRCCAAGWAG